MFRAGDATMLVVAAAGTAGEPPEAKAGGMVMLGFRPGFEYRLRGFLRVHARSHELSTVAVAERRPACATVI